MKNNQKILRRTALILTLCLGMAGLAGCGKKEKEASANTEKQAESAEAAESTNELKEYVIEGIGTLYLPEGFEEGEAEEGQLGKYAVFTKDNMTVYAVRFDKTVYESVGIALPENLEEFSQRDGVRKDLPEDAEFTEDAYGNYYVEYTKDGTVTYNVLKQGTDAVGNIIVWYPEGEEVDEDFPLWISKSELE